MDLSNLIMPRSEERRLVMAFYAGMLCACIALWLGYVQAEAEARDKARARLEAYGKGMQEAAAYATGRKQAEAKPEAKPAEAAKRVRIERQEVQA